MDKMNFITQTYDSRAEVVKYQAKMLSKYYSDSTYYIYDGGLSPQNRSQLNSFEIVEIVDWKEKVNYSREEGVIKNSLADFETRLQSNKYINHICSEILGYNFVHSNVLRWNYFIKQKPLTILDLSKKVEGNIFWMDDDTILLNPIDKMFDDNFDIAVTVRSKYNERKLSEAAVNTGVIVFNTTSEIIQAFVQKWLSTINELDPSPQQPNAEQDAVNNILLESDQNIMDRYYNTTTLKFNSLEATARVLPCNKYNHFVFDSGILPEENNIIHFKGGELERNINKKLLVDIYKGNLEKWTRR